VQKEGTSPGYPLSEYPVTQQYLAGEFSSLLAGLEPAPSAPLRDAVQRLRRRVEFEPLSMLPQLAREAMSLTDTFCWAALEQGDAGGFSRYAEAAATLREFTINANLVPEWPG
jgi:hypothetical protein